jgi:hypothetical protein
MLGDFQSELALHWTSCIRKYGIQIGESMNVGSPCQCLLIRNALSTPERRRNDKKMSPCVRMSGGERDTRRTRGNRGNQEASSAHGVDRAAEHWKRCATRFELHTIASIASFFFSEKCEWKLYSISCDRHSWPKKSSNCRVLQRWTWFI